MVAKWCGVVSSSRSQSEFPFLQKGWPAIAKGVVSVAVLSQNSPSVEGVAGEARRGSVGNTRQDLFEKTSAIVSQHYPVFLHKLSLMQKSTPSKKGEFCPSFFIFLSQKVVLGYSPSCRRGGRDSERGSFGSSFSV